MGDLPAIYAKDKNGNDIHPGAMVTVDGDAAKVQQVICTHRDLDDPTKNIFTVAVEMDGETTRVKPSRINS
jgi:hypothetical protein